MFNTLLFLLFKPDFLLLTDKTRRDESLYHPRLTYVEPEEDEESEEEFSDQRSHSDGSYSPRRSRMSSGGSSNDESPRRRPGPKRLNSVSPSSPRKPERRSERMFDDSDDDDSSSEKEGTNLNWTPAEVVSPSPGIAAGTSRRRGVPTGSKDQVSSSGSGLINLCANVPPVAASGGSVPADTRPTAALHQTPPPHGQYICEAAVVMYGNRLILYLCHSIVMILRLINPHRTRASALTATRPPAAFSARDVQSVNQSQSQPGDRPPKTDVWSPQWFGRPMTALLRQGHMRQSERLLLPR